MCESMADIQSATAEIRRGKKEEEEEERRRNHRASHTQGSPLYMAATCVKTYVVPESEISFRTRLAFSTICGQ